MTPLPLRFNLYLICHLLYVLADFTLTLRRLLGSPCDTLLRPSPSFEVSLPKLSLTCRRSSEGHSLVFFYFFVKCPSAISHVKCTFVLRAHIILGHSLPTLHFFLTSFNLAETFWCWSVCKFVLLQHQPFVSHTTLCLNSWHHKCHTCARMYPVRPCPDPIPK